MINFALLLCWDLVLALPENGQWRNSIVMGVADAYVYIAPSNAPPPREVWELFCCVCLSWGVSGVMVVYV